MITVSPFQESRATRYHDMWEDNYGAQMYDTFEAFMADCENWLAGPYASLNIPIWCDWGDLSEGYDEPDEPIYLTQHLQVGIFMPRHGRCVQWYAPATEDQAMEFRRFMLNIWAQRADTGFTR